MSNFELIPTKLKDMHVITHKRYSDQRGYFLEAYHKQAFYELGLNVDFVQDNQSKSVKGVLRGMHLQTKHSQGKLVRVIKGEVFDVGIDLRTNSETFGKWDGYVLSENNNKMLYIPEGFAHGFLVLSTEVIFEYKCTDYYYPEYEDGIIFDDVDLNISWPEIDCKVVISDKDKKLKTFAEYKKAYNLGD